MNLILLITTCCFGHFGDRNYKVRERAQATLIGLAAAYPDAVSDALGDLHPGTPNARDFRYNRLRHPDAEVVARWTTAKVYADVRCLEAYSKWLVVNTETVAIMFYLNVASPTNQAAMAAYWSYEIHNFRASWQFIKSQKKYFDPE